MMFLIVLCSFWLHFSKLCMLLVRKNPRKNWKSDCLHLTLISNKVTNILEVSQFCYSGREKKKQENLNLFFFQVEHLRVLLFIQTKLLLPNFEAGTISDKKNHTTPRLSPITYSLSPNFSWPFFHFFWCAFTVRRPSRKVHAIHEDGWSPHENLYSFLAPSIMKPLKAAQVYRCYSWTLKLVEYAQLRGNCALKYKDKPGVNFPPPSPLPWFRLAFSPPILGLCLILKMLYFLQKVINPEWEIS